MTHLATVHPTLLGQGLGRYEGRGPGRVAEQSVGAVELVAHPEISYPHPSVVAQQQVARLQVSVDYFLEVHCQREKKEDIIHYDSQIRRPKGWVNYHWYFL